MTARAGEIVNANKAVVERYIEGFNKSDHAQILSCLTDDAEWIIPGMFHVAGKEDFDKEIENEATPGTPVVRITRMIEEGEFIVAEGTVRAGLADGGVLNAVFCDVFEFDGGKIRRLTSYLVALPEAG